MATVYSAEDVRHRRRVALKVLHPELTAVLGADRFLQEIRLTASMQHPHILPLFDSGEADGQLFYVMPFVDGETLRMRLDRETQLPIDDALRIAREVADALEYAHGRGIVHRDIKPENILLQGDHAVVADFGIALAVHQAGGQRMTQTGLSLGTPQYMAPEQAMGDKNIDLRADIYALGAVVYEMLTGEPPFSGPSAQAIVARVLTAAPLPLTASRATIPPHVEAAVLTALAKLPADRFATARDFADALSGERPVASALSPRAIGPSALRRRLAVTSAPWIVAMAATAIALWSREKPTPVAATLATFTIGVPDTLVFGAGTGTRVTISPDGSEIVYSLRTFAGSQMLYKRRMDDTVLRPIRGTEGATGPEYSPDGRSIVFTAQLPPRGFIVPASGGTARPATPDAFGGLCVTTDGRILSSDRHGSLWIENADGSNRRLLVGRDSVHGIVRIAWPEVLPGGSHALVTYWRAQGLDAGRLALVSMSDGRLDDLGVVGLNPHYASPGFIVYALADGDLYATPFSVTKRRVSGTPVRLFGDVGIGTGGAASMGVSNTGTLVMMQGLDRRAVRGMYAVDQHGAEHKISRVDTSYSSPRVSPDGRHVAVSLRIGGVTAGAGPRSNTIAVYDVAAGNASRLVPDSSVDRAEWSADGSRLYFRQQLDDGADLWSRPWDLSAPPRREAHGDRGAFNEISLASHLGIVAFRNEIGPTKLLITTIDSLQNAHPIIEGSFNSFNPRISPSGTLLAYSSNETKRSEVYVTPLPGPGPRMLVSVDGGSEPVWSPDGKKLFYRSGNGSRSGETQFGYLMAATIVDKPVLAVSRRDTLFRDIYTRSEGHAAYDAFPDGRLLMLRTADPTSRERVTPLVIMNWQRMLSNAGAR